MRMPEYPVGEAPAKGGKLHDPEALGKGREARTRVAKVVLEKGAAPLTDDEQGFARDTDDAHGREGADSDGQEGLGREEEGVGQRGDVAVLHEDQYG
jgi:hypothetical protein